MCGAGVGRMCLSVFFALAITGPIPNRESIVKKKRRASQCKDAGRESLHFTVSMNYGIRSLDFNKKPRHQLLSHAESFVIFWLRRSPCG